jgi:hypothetical protein
MCRYKLILLLHDEDKIGRFLITWIAALEEADWYVPSSQILIYYSASSPATTNFSTAFEDDQAVSSFAF